MIYFNPKEIDVKIKELATDEFLATLTELAKVYGWESDYIEIICFVQWAYKKAEKEHPDLEPYDYDDNNNLIIP